MTQTIFLQTAVNPDDYQTTVIQAGIQLEADGEWFVIEEMKELLHEVGAVDLADFHAKFKLLAERIGAKFEPGDIVQLIAEINKEDVDED